MENYMFRVNTNYLNLFNDCDDDREDYYTIAGRVQNLREWLEEE